jgi:hypothetical protein
MYSTHGGSRVAECKLHGRRAQAASGAAGMMRGNCTKILIALSAISLLIVVARSAIHLLHTDEVTAAIEGGHHPRTRSLLAMPFLGLRPPESLFGNGYPFSVIIISYHKTGVSLIVIFFAVVSSSPLVLTAEERDARNYNKFDPSRQA